METIGHKIKRLRKSNGLSLMELSKIVGVSDTALSKIETGKTTGITIELGRKLCDPLKTSFVELFDVNILVDNQLIEILKEENIRLKKENETVRKQLEDYQLLVEFLKHKNMITSPQEKISEENIFLNGGDEYLMAFIKSLDEDNQKIMVEIQKNPILRKYLEDGTITSGRHFQVWKDYLEKK